MQIATAALDHAAQRFRVVQIPLLVMQDRGGVDVRHRKALPNSLVEFLGLDGQIDGFGKRRRSKDLDYRQGACGAGLQGRLGACHAGRTKIGKRLQGVGSAFGSCFRCGCHVPRKRKSKCDSDSRRHPWFLFSIARSWPFIPLARVRPGWNDGLQPNDYRTKWNG